jgi:hypothetical protein
MIRIVIGSREFLRQPLALTLQPETRDLELALSGATFAVLHSVDGLSRIFPQNGNGKTVKRYLNLWSELVP